MASDGGERGGHAEESAYPNYVLLVHYGIMTPSIARFLRIAFLAGLLTWGIYATLIYFAIPVHQTVLVADSQRTGIAEACAQYGLLCQGWLALIPSITHTISRAGPFAWYLILSLLAAATYLFVQFMNRGDWRLSIRLTPLKLIGIFFASIWLMFTVLTFSGGDQPLYRMVEPSLTVYPNIGEQALAGLQQNFASLQSKNCLTEVGVSAAGGKVFDMKMSCIQGAFFRLGVTQFLFIFFILFDLLVFGSLLLKFLRRPQVSLMMEAMLSVGLGACAMIAILWALAAMGVYTQLAGWALVLLIPALCYQQAWYWIQKGLHHEWTFEDTLYGGMTAIAWLLISYLALNFLSVVRPFPIGWDDLGRYLNQPRLLVSYAEAIPTMAAFYWEYMTSLGFLLFGYDSVFGATASMMINWMAGLLAVLVTFVFGRTYMGKGAGMLSALVYYTLPMVGHFSFADMKIDNAMYFMGALTILAYFDFLFPRISSEQEGHELSEAAPATFRERLGWMILAGVFASFAFALKPTAIIVIMAMLAALFGASVHWTAFVGAALFAWGYYTKIDRFNVAEVGRRVFGDAQIFDRVTVTGIFMVTGLAFLGYAFWKYRAAFIKTLIAAGLFMASFAVCMLPWITYNNISYGNVVPSLVFTSANHYTPNFVMDGSVTVSNDPKLRVLPEHLKIDPNADVCKGTAKEEEIDRYWGYDHHGWKHYLTLPWRAVMNIDAAGYYVTLVPGLLLFPLLLLMPAFWSRRGRWMRWLFVATLFMLIQWVFFANGIIWYGLGMFFGFAVALEFLFAKDPDQHDSAKGDQKLGTAARVLCGILIFCSFITAFGHRFWQFEQQRNMLEYPMGKITAEAMRLRTVPYYDDIRQVVMDRFANMPDRPYVFRMGTFIPYFIPRNLEVLPVADNQLTFFNCLNQGDDPAVITQRLKALGFNSIIFDTNTATIEQNLEGTLHKKVERFVDYVNDPRSGLQVKIFDPEAGLAFIIIP